MDILKSPTRFALFFLMFMATGFSQVALQGPVWTLTNLVDGNGGNHSVTTKNYTIEFKSGGQAAIKADCNGCGATYASSGTALTLTLGLCTRMFCGDNSLENQYLAALALVRTWDANGNTLFLKNAGSKTLLTLTNGSVTDSVVPGKPINAFYQDWTLQRVGLKSHNNPPVTGSYYLNLKKDAGVSYKFDCNSCSGTFSATDLKLKIGTGMCTMMACMEGDAIAPLLELAFKDSADYLLKGNELFILFTNRSDTLVYKSKQSTGFSPTPMLKDGSFANWAIESHFGSVEIRFTELPRFYRLSAYTMRGQLVSSTTGSWKLLDNFTYSFQPGNYLMELEIGGQKQYKMFNIKYN